MDTARYVITVLLIVGLPPAVVMWYVVHPFIGFWRRMGPAVTFTFVGVLMLGGGAGLFLGRDYLVGPDLGGSLITAAVGLIFVAGAVVLGVKRKKYLTFRILSGVPELDASGKGGKLLTEGPYAVIRHPRYVEVALGVFGYAALGNYLGGYVMAAATLPLLHLIVILEERELLDRFGTEYEEYRRRVPRYVPRVGSAQAKS